MKKLLLYTLALGLSVTLVSCGENFKSVKSIALSDYTNTIDVGETYTYDGKVTAVYTDNSTQDVTSECTYSTIDTTKAGEQTLSVSYTYKSDKVTKFAKINVVDSYGTTITPSEAVAIIDSQDINQISSEEYLVKGIVAPDAEEDANGFNGTFLNTSLKFRSVKPNGKADVIDDIIGKQVVIKGYLQNYKDIYQIPYLPASASPTGEKYNATLIDVIDIEQEETVDVTQVTLSPVNKTLVVGEIATLSATVMPQNATNKDLSWSTSASSVCTVTQDGIIKGIKAGTAVVTAKSSNGITAECNVTVKSSEQEQLDGDTYAITFNNFESDGQTELTTSTVLDQITSGANYIESVTHISKVYKGQYGLKFGSTRSGGSFSFELSSSFSNLDCKQIIVEPKQYGTKSTTVSIYADDDLVKSGSSADSEVIGTLANPKKVSEIEISTSSRAYISKITLICGKITPIPVTAISLPSTKSISTGNEIDLAVTYSPSNANTGKTITWTTSKASVATVSNGTVHGVEPGQATITATTENGKTASCIVTVSNVNVTDVSVSPTSETLGIGSTKQLTATVSPSNATNKNVTWSSSNSLVASVSSSGLVTALAVGNATITVKTADGNKQATCAITVQEQQKDAWTIMIYMCGSDLESESGLATSDIKEILSVKNQPDNVNILIQTGGSKSWSLGSTYISGATKIETSKLSRWHVENKKIVLDKTLSYSSMGSSSTLQSYLEWGLTEYPAQKTGVIFWNHGGAMYGCCYDELKSDDSLTNSEMKTAFSKALANTGSSKLEFVGYDTCLTQVQDIAEFNSNYFNYMIASEESESGYGWDYDTWVDDLYTNKPTETILKAIVDGFITDNGGASSSRSDQTLSYLDLSQMPAYKTAFENFASALKTKFSSNSVSKKTFASWMDKNVKAFAVDSESSETYFCLFDVKDMLNQLSSNNTYNPGASYINAVNAAFSNLVKYSVAQKGAGNAYGLGCIYSQGSSDAYYIKEAYTSSETNFSNWLSFLKTYSYLA